ncbi:TPA: hypothetical protein ACNTUM_000667 [Escherichia coli]|nr:hypothetical protein [Escherichia coli]HCO3884104.1 hypothetical protein [Escherichia coli]
MESLVVERNEDGYWTHPEYSSLFGDREIISKSEFNAFCEKHGIESTMVELECDDNEEVKKSYFEDGNPDISKWQPSRPEGDGWFIGSIHDTEDGAVCVWFRKKN